MTCNLPVPDLALLLFIAGSISGKTGRYLEGGQ